MPCRLTLARTRGSASPSADSTAVIAVEPATGSIRYARAGRLDEDVGPVLGVGAEAEHRARDGALLGRGRVDLEHGAGRVGDPHERSGVRSAHSINAFGSPPGSRTVRTGAWSELLARNGPRSQEIRGARSPQR